MVRGMPEQWSTAEFSLYPSCLLSLSTYYLLLQVTAELHSSSCTHFWITDWLKGEKKRGTISYVISSLRLWRKFNAQDCLPFLLCCCDLTYLAPSLSYCAFYISFFYFTSQVLPGFLFMFTSFPSDFHILKTNASCRKTITFVENIIHYNTFLLIIYFV